MPGLMQYGAQAPLLHRCPDTTLPNTLTTPAGATSFLGSFPSIRTDGGRPSSHVRSAESSIPTIPTVPLPTSTPSTLGPETQSHGKVGMGIAERARSVLWQIVTIGGLLSGGKYRTKSTPRRLGWRPMFNPPISRQKNSTLSGSNRADSPTHIPQYVLDYAPFCYLYSGEEYWPGKMEVHLDHTSPRVDYDEVPDEFQNPTLDNLDKLNNFGRNVFLQSHDDPDAYPDWIAGSDNIPNDPNYRKAKGGRRRKHKMTTKNIPYRSNAPVILVVVDKGAYVDAFWFFFYSFNLGNSVFGIQFGNHVGDWEHTAVRFENGKPTHVFYSEHEWGAAYKWEAAEKHGKRLITYSAFGTHAMYRTPGLHKYILPFGILRDITDRGVLWDPTLNMLSYTYDHKADIVRASDLTPDAPENWFYFGGHWGDKAYPMNDKRQYRFGSELHYVDGPTGPRFKNLGRTHICEGNDDDPCQIRENMVADLLPKIVIPVENGTWRVIPLED